MFVHVFQAATAVTRDRFVRKKSCMAENLVKYRMFGSYSCIYQYLCPYARHYKLFWQLNLKICTLLPQK